MLVQVGKVPWHTPSVPVAQRIIARNTLPSAPEHCVQLRLVLETGVRVVVHLTAAEACAVAASLETMAR